MFLISHRLARQQHKDLLRQAENKRLVNLVQGRQPKRGLFAQIFAIVGRLFTIRLSRRTPRQDTTRSLPVTHTK